MGMSMGVCVTLCNMYDWIWFIWFLVTLHITLLNQTKHIFIKTRGKKSPSPSQHTCWQEIAHTKLKIIITHYTQTHTSKPNPRISRAFSAWILCTVGNQMEKWMWNFGWCDTLAAYLSYSTLHFTGNTSTKGQMYGYHYIKYTNNN